MAYRPGELEVLWLKLLAVLEEPPQAAPIPSATIKMHAAGQCLTSVER